MYSTVMEAKVGSGNAKPASWRRLIIGLLHLVVLPIVMGAASRAATEEPAAPAHCVNTVKADIVALEQAYVLNRFSAFVPAGMLFALRADVVALDPSKPLRPGNARLRPDKRPRPIVLRVNEGDCLEVKFTNLLSDVVTEEGGIPLENNGMMPSHVEEFAGRRSHNEIRKIEKVSVDRPRTRAASFHITGLNFVQMKPEECPVAPLVAAMVQMSACPRSRD